MISEMIWKKWNDGVISMKEEEVMIMANSNNDKWKVMWRSNINQ